MEEIQTFTLNVEQMKWLLGFAVAGYPVLFGFIVYLVRELVKAKDEEMETLKEIIPLKVKLMDLCQKMLDTINFMTKKGS